MVKSMVKMKQQVCKPIMPSILFPRGYEPPVFTHNDFNTLVSESLHHTISVIPLSELRTDNSGACEYRHLLYSSNNRHGLIPPLTSLSKEDLAWFIFLDRHDRVSVSLLPPSLFTTSTAASSSSLPPPWLLRLPILNSRLAG